MASLRITLGLIPSTEKLEAKKAQLQDEYDRLNQIASSDTLKKYNELKATVESGEFQSKRKEIEAQKFADTGAFEKEKEYKKLKKDKEVKNYYKIKDSDNLNRFEQLEDSDTIMQYEALKEEINSADFKEKKAYLKLSPKKKFQQTEEFRAWKKYNKQKKNKKLRETDEFKTLESQVNSEEFQQKKSKTEQNNWKDSEEYKKEQTYKNLSKSSDVKFYYKFKDSAMLANYYNMEGSEKIKRFEELEKYINSEEFKSVKDFMKLSAKEKFKRSEQHKTLQEFQELDASDDIQFYFKNKDHKKYNEIKEWSLTFEDNFATTVSSDKWLKKYFYGEAVLQDTYSIVEDKQLYADKNIERAENTLKIVTKKEANKGKTWDARYGFFEKEYEYTSGIINTGNVFRQKYGKFEAKIRFNSNHPVQHAFWMVGDKRVPHVDIVKANSGLSFNAFYKNGDEKAHKTSIKGPGRYRNDYYIYSLEWTDSKLTWKINDIEVGSKSTGVPQEEMYIALSSAVHKDISNEKLPAVMEVDWVKCWEQNN